MILDQFDMPIMQYLTGFVGHNNLFDRLVYSLAYYDIFKGVTLISLVWVAWFYQPKKETSAQQDARRAQLLVVFVGVLSAVALSRLFQLVLHVHQRPLLAGLNLNYPNFIDPATVNTWNCFPSDHSMLFFSLAMGLWSVNRRIGGFAFFWAAIMVDLPRIYLGYHYPSDVIVGALLGVAWMLFCLWATPLKIAANGAVNWGKKHPAIFYWLAFLTTEETAHLFDDIRAVGHAIINFLLGKS